MIIGTVQQQLLLLTGDGEDDMIQAWVNFNGDTMVLNGNFNISSITDHGVGDYTINFTTALADANYGAVGTNDAPVNGSTPSAHVPLWVASPNVRTTKTTTALAVSCFKTTNSAHRADPTNASVAVVR